MPARSSLPLAEAVDLTRTGDVWLFRGRSAADHAIRTVTNSPVNHVGMAVVLDDLPPLMWHAELGRGLVDLWTGKHQRGVQLHDLGDAVRQWSERYEQRAWLRQLQPEVDVTMEQALLSTIARLDGMPFPATVVMRPATRGAPGRFAVSAPGRPPTSGCWCAPISAGCPRCSRGPVASSPPAAPTPWRPSGCTAR